MKETHRFRTIGLTCCLVTDQFAALNFPNTREEGANVVLGHGLGKVVHDEVGLRVLVGLQGLHGSLRATILLDCGGLHAHHWASVR